MVNRGSCVALLKRKRKMSCISVWSVHCQQHKFCQTLAKTQWQRSLKLRHHSHQCLQKLCYLLKKKRKIKKNKNNIFSSPTFVFLEGRVRMLFSNIIAWQLQREQRRRDAFTLQLQFSHGTVEDIRWQVAFDLWCRVRLNTVNTPCC